MKTANISVLDLCSFAVAAQKGVYAVLLGSGLSRSAQIPTGWEITLDLVRRLAVSIGEKGACEADSEQWYREQFDGQEPDYSTILQRLAPTPAERRRILETYIEPEAETEAHDPGYRRPTAAHKAIAELMRDGLIRVVITTNFDRLLEEALNAIGVAPTVLSTDDAIMGAEPLVHRTQPTILKLHGDYKDARILNTNIELTQYAEARQMELGKLLDEFGLIVCGWSGEWDTALRNAILRSQRRYQCFWASMGGPSEKAKELILHRQASVIEIAGADSFFEDLKSKVSAIVEYQQPHPLSTQAALVQFKRYLSEEKYDIKLREMLLDEVERVLEATSREKLPVNGFRTDKEIVQVGKSRLEQYDAITKTLQHLLATGCYYGKDRHIPIWIEALRRVDSDTPEYNGFLVELRRIPFILSAYAAGVATAAARNHKLLTEIFSAPATDSRFGKLFWKCRSNPVTTYKDALEIHRYAAGSCYLWDRLVEVMRPYARHFGQTGSSPYGDYGSDFNRAFDFFEVLMFLNLSHYDIQLRWKITYMKPEEREDTRLLEEVEQLKNKHPLLLAGMWDGDYGRFSEEVTSAKEATSRARGNYGRMGILFEKSQ